MRRAIVVLVVLVLGGVSVAWTAQHPVGQAYLDDDDDHWFEVVPSGPALGGADFSVDASGNVQGASYTAFTTTVDASLRVGNTEFNQVNSGRLVFDENFNDPGAPCGFEFRHDGDANTLTLGSECVSGVEPLPSIVVNRAIALLGEAGRVDFPAAVAIQGGLNLGTGTTATGFNGSGGSNDGGLFPVAFLGNPPLTCNDVCGSHGMVCNFAVNLTSFLGSTCVAQPGDITLQLCLCNES